MNSMKNLTKVICYIICLAVICTVIIVSENSEKTAQPQSAAGESEQASSDQTVESPHSIGGAVTQKERVGSDYFDDAVFIGDSVSKMLEYYESEQDVLGKAQFLTSVSLSAENAQWDVDNKYAVHPKLNGQKMKIEDSIKSCGAKKVYIMLGMNDIENLGVDDAFTVFKQLCSVITEKNPDVQLCVESLTPRVKDCKEIAGLTNETIHQYNLMLCQLCSENGWYFINLAEVMFDGEGYLKNEYCSDVGSLGMHMTYDGCKAWVDYLCTHTP